MHIVSLTTCRIALTIVCSLSVAFGGCGATREATKAPELLEPLWKPLSDSCPCPTPEFKSNLHKVVDQWEFAKKCHVDRKECRELAHVDKSRLKNKISLLEQKLDDWWRLPIVWCAVGLLAGFGLGAAFAAW